MAKEAGDSQLAESFEYELFEDDPDHLQTVVASSSQISLWIEPEKLKLRHRIGRGLFGDVWLATHHHSTKDYDEYHEVAAKMIHPVQEDHVKILIDKFQELYFKCQGVSSVCVLHGSSIVNGKFCIIMKFYEGSIGDKMAHLKAGHISLANVLRYGIDVAQGISGLHSKGILALNLKPCNWLLNDNDQAILGDVGIPYLLHKFPFPNSDVAHRLGSPNYMAPEQWEPEVRGPISFETDSWGFGCTIVEMLTGLQPWSGKSVGEMYHLVVRKHEKPAIPAGLPSPIDKLLRGCFEYDFRNRPLMTDILHVFKSSLRALTGGGGGWTYAGNISLEKSSNTVYTDWYLSKDNLQVGDMVRSRKSPNSYTPQNMEVPEGTIVGLERDADQGFVLVRIHGIHDPLRIHVSTLERVTFGLAAGDWVRLKEENKKHSPVGILHSINRDGDVEVGFLGLETLWRGSSSDFQMAESLSVGQFVRLKATVLNPRFEWPRKTRGAWATGRISWILPNGCLIVKFPGILAFGNDSNTFLAEPSEVEVVNFSTCAGMVKKYQHLEDFHWAVRPILIALGLFTGVKFGLFVGKKMGQKRVSSIESEPEHKEDQNPTARSTSGNPGWVPPSVSNIFSKRT